MPIKPELAKRYPPNWKQLRAEVLERAGHKCEQCGVPNYAAGYRDDQGNFYTLKTGMLKIVLTIAHLDHDELETTDITRLKCLCQKCHLAYDHEHHMKNSRATRKNRKALGDLFA